MIKVGKTDVFERQYMEKFRLFASTFGEFVQYERDRGARDIGLHLTKKLGDGQERLSAALCWFQMKGLMASTLSEAKFEKLEVIKLSLEVAHLQYWFLQAMPTYLVVYVESVDKFLIMNIQKYVSEKWGQKILTLKQLTTTVEIPTESVLDEEAFQIILRLGDVGEWSKVLGSTVDRDSLHMCQRDYEVIYNIGTAERRNVESRMVFWSWLSKMRGQVFIQQQRKKQEAKWITIREHWQYLMSMHDLERTFPYLEFQPFYSKDDLDEFEEIVEFTLPNGEEIYGVNRSDEFEEYVMHIRLNSMGEQMLEWIEILRATKLVNFRAGRASNVSVAPWHGRAV